ncbi:phosphotransferase [Streptomyces sp. NPDC051567]|uniref:phosphotransferase n=1 Tax=Streptomyces sp. NPDC051567 TaxID=3365660 RepID=UPI00378C9A83
MIRDVSKRCAEFSRYSSDLHVYRSSTSEPSTGAAVSTNHASASQYLIHHGPQSATGVRGQVTIDVRGDLDRGVPQPSGNLQRRHAAGAAPERPAAPARERRPTAAHLARHVGSGSAADRAAVRAAMQEQAREAADCLQGTATHLAADRIALVEAASKNLVDLAGHLPLVFQHSDYTTRNWLYNTATGRHSLIDFAIARYSVAAEELVWLSGAVRPLRPRSPGPRRKRPDHRQGPRSPPRLHPAPHHRPALIAFEHRALSLYHQALPDLFPRTGGPWTTSMELIAMSARSGQQGCADRADVGMCCWCVRKCS